MQHRALGNAAIAVLAALASGYKYGFDIMDHTGLKSGSVYRALSRLEELRFTSSKWEGARIAVQEKRPRRRYYEITEGQMTIGLKCSHWIQGSERSYLGVVGPLCMWKRDI